MATARKTKAAHRQTQAVEMMLAGKDFDTIAAELGYATRSGAWRAVQRALSKQREALAGEYLMLEMQRLDALQMALWDRAMAKDRLHGVVHDGGWFTVDTPENLAAAPDWLARQADPGHGA